MVRVKGEGAEGSQCDRQVVGKEKLEYKAGNRAVEGLTGELTKDGSRE